MMRLKIIALTLLFSLQTAAGNSPRLIATPPAISLTMQAGGAPPVTTLDVTSSGAALTFYVAVSTVSGGDWLSVGPWMAGATPATLAVSLNPSPIVGAIAAYPAPGTYKGVITLTSAGAANSPLTVAVTLTVTAAARTAPP
jgi:hypothetical protein